MANTYTQLYVHIVFAVARRETLIADGWMPALYAYLTGICRNRQHFVHAIGGISDHVHLLVGMHPSESIATLVKELKGQSTRWVNGNHMHGEFSWQAGYGAFTYSRSQLPAIKAYIGNQREHHRHVSFQEELADIMRKFKIDYNPDYMMKGFVQPEEKSRT